MINEQEKQELQDQINDLIKQDEKAFLPQTNQESQTNIEKLKKVQILDPSKNEEETQLAREDENSNKVPLTIQERRQTVQVYEVLKEKSKWGEFYRVFGICLMLLGGYFLIVPGYNVICQTFGFSMRQHAKEYVFKEEEVNVFRKYRISFMAHTQDDLPWEFEPQTNSIVVNAGETALAFYRVYNRSDKPISGISVYQIFPEEVALYFNKIQCFCFENQLLYPKEQVDLPILFYLDPSINHEPLLQDTKDILLTYHFFPSADQTIAQVLQQEIEKHQEEQKKLLEKRQKLKDAGIELEGSQEPSGVLGPGHNPKESAEMYVQKILRNQKRISHTIEIYEQEQTEKNKKIIQSLLEESKSESGGSAFQGCQLELGGARIQAAAQE